MPTTEFTNNNNMRMARNLHHKLVILSGNWKKQAMI